MEIEGLSELSLAPNLVLVKTIGVVGLVRTVATFVEAGPVLHLGHAGVLCLHVEPESGGGARVVFTVGAVEEPMVNVGTLGVKKQDVLRLRSEPTTFTPFVHVHFQMANLFQQKKEND